MFPFVRFHLADFVIMKSNLLSFSNWYKSVSSVFVKLSLFCSCALLDAVHWVAASSPLTAVCITCGLPSVPCWSAMSTHTCGSEYHQFVLGQYDIDAFLYSARWRKSCWLAGCHPASVCPWTSHWVHCRGPSCFVPFVLCPTVLPTPW